MSISVVIDCSYILGGILPDEEAINLDTENIQMYVPAIFYLECGNVLVNAVKKNRINKQNFLDYLEIIQSLNFTIDHFSSSPESLKTIAKLASKFDLSSYDASYVELSLRIDADLRTNDKKLKGIFSALKSQVLA